MLDTLFKKNVGGLDGLRATLKENGLSDYDLNVLYSIYQFLYNSDNNHKSLIDIEYNTFYSEENEGVESFTQGEYPISESLFGFIDRLT
jgi:hypothetical protein